jgi:hypothetical protein
LSLLKKSGKVFIILFPRVPPTWPTMLQRQVFDDAIKIAMRLVVCFLQSQFHHRWQHHGAIFIKKIKPESPRSSSSVLSHNTPAVLHQIQVIFTENCSSKSRLSLFQHGHPIRWLPTMGKSDAQQAISKPHLLMMITSESMPQACLQACSPLKLSSCCKYRVYYTYITESFLQQPSLHAISTLISLYCGLTDTKMEPATQAWFKKQTLCSLSHGKEKNTSESLEIQRGLHDISVLITLFLLMTLKCMMIDLPDQIHYFTYLRLSGVSTKQFAMQRLYWYGGQCIFGANHWKQYTVCMHECYYSPFTCQSRSLCSFLSKSLSTVGQGCQMHPENLPKTRFVQCLLSRH